MCYCAPAIGDRRIDWYSPRGLLQPEPKIVNAIDLVRLVYGLEVLIKCLWGCGLMASIVDPVIHRYPQRIGDSDRYGLLGLEDVLHGSLIRDRPHVIARIRANQ